jgi:hypothetical protein
VRLEGLGQLKKCTSSWLDTATLLLVAGCLNNYANWLVTLVCRICLLKLWRASWLCLRAVCECDVLRHEFLFPVSGKQTRYMTEGTRAGVPGWVLGARSAKPHGPPSAGVTLLCAPPPPPTSCMWRSVAGVKLANFWHASKFGHEIRRVAHAFMSRVLQLLLGYIYIYFFFNNIQSEYRGRTAVVEVHEPYLYLQLIRGHKYLKLVKTSGKC